MKKRRLRIIMFAAMVAVVGCKTQTAFYDERVYHAEGHWPKESTDEGGKWTLCAGGSSSHPSHEKER